jgi:glycogen synthase
MIIKMREGYDTQIDEQGLRWGLRSALDLYHNEALRQKIIRNGMAMDFSWEHQGAQYVDLFRKLSGLS